MNLYNELAPLDILEPVKNRYKIEFDKDGSPKIFLKATLDCDTPWISNCVSEERKCNLWGAYFNNYGIISQGCLKCYKIVMTIPTLRDLFRVLAYQKGELTCKCGVERRKYVGKVGKYGAYWYAPLSDGLEGGRVIYNNIRKAFPQFPLILKRGCTEFEMAYHPSSRWDEIAKERDWKDTEALLDSIFVADPMAYKVEMNTPPLLEMSIIRRWVEYAFEHGDETYLDFTNNQPLKLELETYHNGGKYDTVGSTKTSSVGNNRLDRASDEDSGVPTERNSSLVQGLPDD